MRRGHLFSPRSFFFFNDTATTEIYTLSLHDALPICERRPADVPDAGGAPRAAVGPLRARAGGGASSQWSEDRKRTRLNSSHANISYAVFCLKKKLLAALMIAMLAAPSLAAMQAR